MSFRGLMNWRSWADKQARDTRRARYGALRRRALALESFIQRYLDESVGSLPISADTAGRDQSGDMSFTDGQLRLYLECKASRHHAVKPSEQTPAGAAHIHIVEIRKRRDHQLASHLLRLLAVEMLMRSEALAPSIDLVYLAVFPAPSTRRCYRPVRLRPNATANAPDLLLIGLRIPT